MAPLPVYRTKIDPEWIDFNGHLRDAYYGLILSYALDELMDQVGLDAAYRARTRCTLYTLEEHIHFLHEVKDSDELEIRTSILDRDRKRLHVRCVFGCARVSGPVAVAEAMLLHVYQGEKPVSTAFPAEIAQLLGRFDNPQSESDADFPVSRKIEIKRR